MGEMERSNSPEDPKKRQLIDPVKIGSNVKKEDATNIEKN